MAEEQNDGKPATTIIYPVAIIAFDDQNFDDIAGRDVGARNYQTEFRTVFVGSHNIETVVLVKCENCEPLQR